MRSESAPSSETVKPFVRWAGSKRLLLTHLEEHLPKRYDRYVEPFLGGGSLFLKLGPAAALLNDACLPLVETWNAIKSNPSLVHSHATRLPLTEGNYYAQRAETSGDCYERAGRFIFLNSGAFGGLYRVNRSGGFNVPWGKPKTGHTVELATLERVSDRLNRAGTEVSHGDFGPILDESVRGDLVFLDPPYVTTHSTNGFVDYNERVFSWADQKRLATSAENARTRGAFVVVSNADHASVKSLYPAFRAFRIERSSTLAAAASKRRQVSELILVGRPQRRSPSSTLGHLSR